MASQTPGNCQIRLPTCIFKKGNKFKCSKSIEESELWLNFPVIYCFDIAIVYTSLKDLRCHADLLSLLACIQTAYNQRPIRIHPKLGYVGPTLQNACKYGLRRQNSVVLLNRTLITGLVITLN